MVHRAVLRVVRLYLLRRGRHWGPLGLILVAWPAAVAIILSDALTLPLPALVNLNAAYITLFVPLSLLLGLAADRLWHWLGRWPVLRLAAHAPLGASLAALLLFGLQQQASILNPVTILAQPADLAGLARLSEQAPTNARVAASSWRWLGQTWAGHDGGAWITPLTGLATTIPPLDYTFDRGLIEAVTSFNTSAEAKEDWADPETGEVEEQHHRSDVTEQDDVQREKLPPAPPGEPAMLTDAQKLAVERTHNRR